MVSDSISIVPIAMASSNQKDLARKRRGNRSAKLKQCKLDARREQWLSQVKNKICKDDPDGDGGFSGKNLHTQESDQSVENLEIKQRGRHNQISVHNYIDSHSNSPTSRTSSVSGSKSGTSFTSSGGSSSSSVGSCSGSVAGEDEEVDDGCLDDWEAVADALASLDCKQEHKSCSEPSLGQGNIDNPNSGYGVGIPYPKPSLEPMETPQRAQEIGRAWKPDDVFRPRSLPYLSKQFSFPIKAEKHHAHGANACGCSKDDVISFPLSCPICCEDMDFTDSSFLPCSCGFRLCLFCHKIILENDGRCPGCRKRYDKDCLNGEATFMGTVMTTRLARSFSMIAKS